MYPWLTSTFQQLGLRIEANKLHHAVLIQGPDGIGKTHFTTKLAELLLCASPQEQVTCGKCQACSLNAAGTHPDLHLVESEKQIGVDQIRQAIKTLSGAAQLSGAKVLIIYGAHTMTESSANALLKTLEEPTNNTYILLTTDKPERILPTIKSRCEKLTLPSPELEMTISWVQSESGQGVDPNFAKLFSSRPLALLAELQQQPDFTYDVFSQGIDTLLAGNADVIKIASQWQEQSERVLKWLQYWLRQQAEQDLAKQDLLWELNQQAIKTSRLLTNPGINKTLVLAQLLEKITRLKAIEPNQASFN